MKLFLLLALLSTNAQSAPDIVSDLTREIPGASQKYNGLKNVKMVMPGVLYRGGGTGGKSPMGSSQSTALCEDGFSSAVYGYRTGWSGDHSVQCGSGSLNYSSRQWDKSSAGEAMLRELHSIIQNGSGPMYVHCWYGVHASGYLAAIALMQFCGYDANQAVDYWNSNVPASIRYRKVQDMIRNFRPLGELQISGEQQARVCPN